MTGDPPDRPAPEDLLHLVTPWEMEEEGELLQTRVFAVRQRRCRSREQQDRAGRFVYLEAPDWVNVVTLTPRGEVVLIEQFRHGLGRVTLEIPGGMVDPGETPVQAGVRELHEETGYAGRPCGVIGSVSPNPALQSNWCHTILVEDASPSDRPRTMDTNEEIGIRLLPLARVPDFVRRGVIHHALVICAFHHLALRDA